MNAVEELKTLKVLFNKLVEKSNKLDIRNKMIFNGFLRSIYMEMETDFFKRFYKEQEKRTGLK